MGFGESNSSLGGIATRIRQVIARQASAFHQIKPGQAHTSEHEDAPDIPDFELLRCIGHGSYGQVWLVRNIVGSYRAVKIINRKAFHDEEAFEREFLGLQRFEPISREHAGFVSILHVGRDRAGGFFYYVMELADDDSGGDLISPDAYDPKTLSSELTRCGRLTVKESAQLGLSLTDALIELHQRGLVHRDIKPSNIIFVKGHAKLADIGLVTHAGEKRRLGTEGYIPPEGPGTAQGDLYSLGKLLYEASTGTDRLEYPDLPHDIDAMAEREAFLQLNSIILKACDNDPRKRYRTATDIHDDLARLSFVDQPIQPVSRKLRRKPVIVLAAVASVIAVIAAATVSVLKSNLSYSAPAKSIAVLPFESLSKDKQDSHLADGIQDEILSDLGKLADLKVIGRTSVAQYKAGSARNLRDIGRQLGVAHLVEGSVERSGNRVRVSADLIDVSNDRHLWAQTYDRELSDVFTIESEIAKSIAAQLRVNLSPAEKNAIERTPTNDLVAFDFYSGARNLLLTTGTDTATVLPPAINLLNLAVAHDPSFFDAWCELAWANDFLYVIGDHTSARLTQAEGAVQKASRLRPNAGEAHLARAWHLYWGYLDYDGALAEVAAASQRLSNNPQVFELTGYIKRRQGKQEEALRNLERAIDLDPRNLFVLQQIAVSYQYVRRFAEEKAVYDRILALDSNDFATKVERALVELDWKADTRPLHQLIDSVRTENTAGSYDVSGTLLLCALAERDAIAAKDALRAIAPQEAPFSDEAVHFSRSFVEGVIARMAKDEGKAQSAFTAAFVEQQKAVQAQPNYGPALCELGLIDAALGRKEEALSEGRRAVELLPVEKDAINGPRIIEYFAMIAAWVGEKDLACEQLAMASQLPNGSTYGKLKLLPFWDPLRRDPCFEAVVSSLAPQLQVRLSAVEKQANERVPTRDVSAFDLYTAARNLLLRTGIESTETILLPAIDMLNQAVARDPSFFEAWYQLAWANDFVYVLGQDHTPARLALAESAIDAASRLRPDAGETHLARAWNFYWGHLKYDAALTELKTARQALPNDPSVFALTGYIQRRSGHWEESMRNLERAVELDPGNLFMLQQIAYSYLYLRRYPQEKAVYDRILSIEPNDLITKVARAVVEMNWKADTQPSDQLIDSIRAAHTAVMPSQATRMWLLCALAERNPGAATDALMTKDSRGTPLSNEAVHFSQPFMEGVIARMTNDENKARYAFTAARAEQQKAIEAQPDYGPVICVLGLIDAALGRKQQALSEGRRAVELLPVEKDAINGPLMIEYLAMIAAWIGDKDLACEQLGIASRLPNGGSYGELKLLPFWDPLRGDPRFEKIVASLAPK